MQIIFRQNQRTTMTKFLNRLCKFLTGHCCFVGEFPPAAIGIVKLLFRREISPAYLHVNSRLGEAYQLLGSGFVCFRAYAFGDHDLDIRVIAADALHKISLRQDGDGNGNLFKSCGAALIMG